MILLNAPLNDETVVTVEKLEQKLYPTHFPIHHRIKQTRNVSKLKSRGFLMSDKNRLTSKRVHEHF